MSFEEQEEVKEEQPVSPSALEVQEGLRLILQTLEGKEWSQLQGWPMGRSRRRSSAASCQ